MKNIIITIIAIFSAVNLYAQTGGVEVYAKSNCSQSSNNIFVVDVFIQAENVAENIYLAEQNYRFDYNDLALINPTLLIDGSDLDFGNPINYGNEMILYSDTSFYSSENIVSISTELLSASGIKLSSTLPIYICSIQFDVLDTSLPINFNWHDSTEFPPTYLSSNNGGFSVGVPAIFYDSLLATVQENCSDSGCAELISDLSDLNIECGDEDGATIVLEVGNPDNVIFESKPLLYWIDNPNFPQFYFNEDNGYYYFEQLPAFEPNLQDGDCGTSLNITITEDSCPAGCAKLIPNLSDLHIECGDEDGATIVLEAGDPNNVSLESQTLSYWIDNPSFPQFYFNEADGYYYFEQLPAFEPSLQDGDCGTSLNITITEDSCPTGCAQLIQDLSDLHIECGDADGATIVLEAGGPDNVILEGQTLSYWVNNPNFPQFYFNEADGYYYFEQLPAFEPNLQDDNCDTTIDIPITEEVCLRKTGNKINHKVYPNPANKIVRVHIVGDVIEGGRVSIYDIAGKQVLANNINSKQKTIQINVEDLLNGIYLIEVNNGLHKIHTQKLTIAH